MSSRAQTDGLFQTQSCWLFHRCNWPQEGKGPHRGTEGGKVTSEYLISKFQESFSVFLMSCQHSDKPTNHQRRNESVLLFLLEPFGPISKANILVVAVLARLLRGRHSAAVGWRPPANIVQPQKKGSEKGSRLRVRKSRV